MPDYAGKVKLVYIDPPFDTGQDFSFTATIPDYPPSLRQESTDFTKQPSIIEQKAYRDTWGRGLDSYLQWFYETIVLLHEILIEDGSIFVHFDWHVGHHAKAVMDEVFGHENFVNEIVLNRGRRKSLQKQFDRISSLGAEHDVILLYRRSESTSYALVKSPIRASDAQWQAFWRGNVKRPTMQYELLGFKPTHGQFLWSRERALRAVKNYEQFLASGEPDLVAYWEGTGRRLEFVKKSKSRAYPEYWIPPKQEGIIGDVWLDIQAYSYLHDYDTEKHEDLLQRIVNMASTEGDLILDCFVGSGTTAAVAEKLNRRWIACDLSRFAIHTTRKRLLEIPRVKPFIIENLGKYERQAWQVAEFPATGKSDFEEQRQREAAYRTFVLDLYRATAFSGNAWLHGARGGRMVHVGAVDAPVTLADVKAIAREAWRVFGSSQGASSTAGVDILGWEFAFEVNELAKQVAAESRIDVAFKKIPREVLDKRAVEQGDVKFFELGALSVGLKQKHREATLKLTDFVIPIDDIPEDARKAIKHWSQLVDYWAVDWDFKGDTFHNQWQTYRTRREPKIELETKHSYPEPGKYTIVVKVIDILGNDTSKTLEAKVV